MDYKGTIIEESLADKSVLEKVTIIGTRIEVVTERHKTPWLKQWTLDTIEVPSAEAAVIANIISKAIDKEHGHAWYADFRNETTHYIIFLEKIFMVDIKNAKEYDEVKKYAIALGIPEYQVDFSPEVEA